MKAPKVPNRLPPPHRTGIRFYDCESSAIAEHRCTIASIVSWTNRSTLPTHDSARRSLIISQRFTICSSLGSPTPMLKRRLIRPFFALRLSTVMLRMLVSSFAAVVRRKEMQIETTSSAHVYHSRLFDTRLVRQFHWQSTLGTPRRSG